MKFNAKILQKVFLAVLVGSSAFTISCRAPETTELSASDTEALSVVAGTQADVSEIPVDLNPISFNNRLRILTCQLVAKEKNKKKDNSLNWFEACMKRETNAKLGNQAQLAASSGSLDAVPVPQCKDDFGNAKGEEEAFINANGFMYYCRNGTIQKSIETPLIREMLVKSGATEEELANIRFFYSPSSIYNAWATVRKIGGKEVGYVNLHRGLMTGVPSIKTVSPVNNDSALASILVHELGHIKDMRKNGFTNLISARIRVRNKCSHQINDASTLSELNSASDLCELNMASNTRSFEHSADNNIGVTFERTKAKLAFNPWFQVDIFNSWGSQTDWLSSHPVGADRALYLKRNLEQRGIENNPELKGTSYISKFLSMM
jgi:hypothetical protein